VHIRNLVKFIKPLHTNTQIYELPILHESQIQVLGLIYVFIKKVRDDFRSLMIILVVFGFS
jgi:hypothetical protein